MNNWKQAFVLAKFEIRESKQIFIYLFLYYCLFISLFVMISYLVGDFYFGGLDIFYLLLFTFVPFWIRPKEFQYQKTHGDIWASPAVITLNQLPIKRDIIIKSRFILYFIYSFPFQLFLLVSLYLLTPNMQTNMSPISYISFSIIWLSFGVYAGLSIVTTDAGDQYGKGKRKLYLTLSFGILIAIILLILCFGLIFSYGIVHWTIIFAQKWPFISAAISTLLAFLGFKHAQQHMKKTMEKIDYL